jgi:hypothetical protein
MAEESSHSCCKHPQCHREVHLPTRQRFHIVSPHPLHHSLCRPHWLTIPHSQEQMQMPPRHPQPCRWDLNLHWQPLVVSLLFFNCRCRCLGARFRFHKKYSLHAEIFSTPFYLHLSIPMICIPTVLCILGLLVTSSTLFPCLPLRIGTVLSSCSFGILRLRVAPWRQGCHSIWSWIWIQDTLILLRNGCGVLLTNRFLSPLVLVLDAVLLAHVLCIFSSLPTCI